MEVGLRSLVLRSEYVFDGVGGREDWMNGGPEEFHLIVVGGRYHSWMLDPWW